MIDFHNHLLPNVDDGSKSVNQSINMINTAVDQGIKEIVCTVHYQHPKMKSKNITYENCMQIMDSLQSMIGNKVKLHLGSEVFYLPNLLEIKKDKLTCLGNSSYMLIEFYPFHIPPNIFKNLFNLKISNTTPIIAHPERNKIIQNDIDIAEKLILSGCLMQLDAGSLLGHFGHKCKQVAIELIKRKMIHVLGSDAHNDQKRNFCLAPAIKSIRDITNFDVDDLTLKNPRKIINGEKIIPYVIKEKESEKFYFFKKFRF